MKFTKLNFAQIAIAIFAVATINGCKKDDVSSNEKPFMNLFSERQAYFEIGDEHFYIYGDILPVQALLLILLILNSAPSFTKPLVQ
nr:hypothetical protein [Bacteroidota bacterium]